MSEQVTYKVKLKPLTEKERQPLLVKIATLDDEDDVEDYLHDRGIIILNHIYYWITKEYVNNYNDFCDVTKNEDGSYDVMTSFYDGCTYLGEVLRENVK